MVISILGCGWYGKALGGVLAENGFTVKGSVTTDDKFAQLAALNITPYLLNINPGNPHYNPDFFACDVLIISIPPKFRQGQGGDYPDKIKSVAALIQKHNVAKVIFISSTRVYGELNKTVTELDAPAPGDNEGQVLLAAEAILQQQTTFKTTILRFAGLVGPGRHPGKFFSGKTAIPNGKAPVNLIHLTDCIGITEAVIRQNAFGHIINGVSPQHPAKMDFYTHATLKASLPAPQFIDELKEWKIVDSVNLAQVVNYQFKAANWGNVSFDE